MLVVCAEDGEEDAAIGGDDWCIDEVSVEERSVDEGDGVGGDVGNILGIMAGFQEGGVLWQVGMCEVDAWFLEAEYVEKVVVCVGEDGGEVVEFGDVIGAEVEGV
jgi:hypothetical protein